MARDAENSYLALDAEGGGPMADLLGHSITYRVAVGPRAGQKVFSEALSNGTGVGLGPGFLIADDLRSERLFDLLPGWCSEAIDISIVYPNRRFLPKKVRAFIDHAAGMQQRGELTF